MHDTAIAIRRIVVARDLRGANKARREHPPSTMRGNQSFADAGKPRAPTISARTRLRVNVL